MTSILLILSVWAATQHGRAAASAFPVADNATHVKADRGATPIALGGEPRGTTVALDAMVGVGADVRQHVADHGHHPGHAVRPRRQDGLAGSDVPAPADRTRDPHAPGPEQHHFSLDRNAFSGGSPVTADSNVQAFNAATGPASDNRKDTTCRDSIDGSVSRNKEAIARNRMAVNSNIHGINRIGRFSVSGGAEAPDRVGLESGPTPAARRASGRLVQVNRDWPGAPGGLLRRKRTVPAHRGLSSAPGRLRLAVTTLMHRTDCHHRG
jgi:hypothetical protein